MTEHPPLARGPVEPVRNQAEQVLSAEAVRPQIRAWLPQGECIQVAGPQVWLFPVSPAGPFLELVAGRSLRIPALPRSEAAAFPPGASLLRILRPLPLPVGHHTRR